jgi:hypothetical protein
MADSSDKLLLFLNAAKTGLAHLILRIANRRSTERAACFYPDNASEKRKITEVSIVTKAGGK